MRKNGGEVLREALEKLQRNTPITSISPGSIARALTEAITTEIGDLYDIMDYNLNQNLLSTATGSALDMLGRLYNLERKSLSNLTALDKQLGSFLFYIETPVLFDIVIPKGTRIFTDATSYIGTRHSYSTDQQITIPAGRRRAYVGLIPNFVDTVFTAGANTLTLHDYQAPATVQVFCTNPKEIAQQFSFESDDNFRARIIKSIRVSSGGTVEAVRFAALAINGVREVKVRQAPYGMGSFEVIVVAEQNGNVGQVISNARTAIESVRPLGARMYVKAPTTIAVDVNVSIIMPGANLSSVSEQAIKRASVGINRYINSLLPGSPLVYNRLLSVIIDSSESIKDVIVKGLAVNGIEILRRNYKPTDEQQLIPGNVTISVATS